jgi:hypothetical protein
MKLPITISLKQSGNEVSGYYHYDKNNVDIRLHGKIDASGNIELEEGGFFQITGYWRGKIVGDLFTGSWLSGDKKRSRLYSCKKIIMNGSPGEPMSSKVAFGEKEIAVLKNKVTVPRSLAEKLFKKMIEEGQIDIENEYQKNVLKKGKENPSILFVGESVDLNNDMVSELIVFVSGLEGACTSSNCPFWIFQKDGNGFIQLLYGSVGVYGYRILDGRGFNFYDVALIEHSSAVDHEYSVYRFDGNEYKPYICFTETAHESKSGELNFTYKEHECIN